MQWTAVTTLNLHPLKSGNFPVEKRKKGKKLRNGHSLTHKPLPALPPLQPLAVSINVISNANLHGKDNMSATTGGLSSFLNDTSTFAPAPIDDKVTKANISLEK